MLSNKLYYKYYPIGSIVDASFGFTPIYAWRSILSAKELTPKGARWRIENGKKVKIWMENWLLDTTYFKMLISVSVLERDAKVCKLIENNLGTWKKDLIHSCFDHEEAS